jgi:hypothetical protein
MFVNDDIFCFTVLSGAEHLQLPSAGNRPEIDLVTMAT